MSHVTLRRRVGRTLWVAANVTAAACGGQQSEPAAPAAGAEPDASAPASAEEREAAEPSSRDADAPAPEPGEYEGADTTPREVRYLVKADGLQIDIDGARFRPRAEAYRVGGGWGVRVEVEAISIDDATHELLGTNSGALAFAGTVNRRGQEQRFGDHREGGEEQMLFPGAPTTLTREWPGTTGQAPLRAGDELALEVGLWGLGADADSRRPVAKFFLIRMRVGAKPPKPLITPPAKL